MLRDSWREPSLAAYYPPPLDPQISEVSPLYADLAGLPPMLLQVGEDELLLNDSLRLAEQARAAGIAVRLECYEGLWHVFQIHARLLKTADQALDRIASFIRESLN